MKGRSHRLRPSDPPDDWGNSSWTVDCSCGVTFDDGEEMVSCDECGVWVHTRCSRFTKGEASFFCHNCKKAGSAKRPGPPPLDEAEETEVAQFLIELPTKTAPGPNRPPFRLWTDVPIEDRVHVLGVPGGDPDLFQGLSSVFTSDLWRCTGYVPKKFSFQAREFPCWDEEEGENLANTGADVLFSLSKEILPHVPMRSFERKVSPDGVKKLEVEKVSSNGGGSCGRSTSASKKERNKLPTFGASSGKKRKEESGEEKDRSAKKKASTDVDKALADSKKRGSVPIIVEGVFQVAESDVPDGKGRDRKKEMPVKPTSTDLPEGSGNCDEHKHLVDVKTSVGALSEQGLKQKGSMEIFVKVEKVDWPDPVRMEVPGKTDAASDGEGSSLPKESVKEEAIHLIEHRVKVNICNVGKKGSATTTVSSEESKQEVSRQPAKGCPKGLISSGSNHLKQAELMFLPLSLLH